MNATNVTTLNAQLAQIIKLVSRNVVQFVENVTEILTALLVMMVGFYLINIVLAATTKFVLLA